MGTAGKRLKKVVIVTGMISMALLGGLGGTLTSYAAGPGEVTNQAVAKPVTYNQQSVKALGSWEAQSNGAWKFKCLDGSYLTNSWVESLSEAGAYYFVGTEGVMLLNSKTPDGYQVDGDGLWRSGVVKQSNETGNSTVGAGSNTNKSSKSSSDEELSPELLKFIRENAGAPAYGGLH